MTPLFPVRRRAEEFADAVDGRAPGTHHDELARLVGVVSALRAQDDVAPRPEFSSALRDRLMSEARTLLTPENAGLALPTRPRGTRERKLVAAATAVVLLGGTTGMAAAAQRALPGEALYPIKRGIEKAEAGLNVTEAGKGRDLLAQARDRLTEVEGLLDKDSVPAAPQLPDTLEDFSTQASEGAALLFDSYEENGDPSSVEQVRTFAAQGIDVLTTLAAQVPPEAQDELAQAAKVLRDLDQRATALCTTCAGNLPVLKIPDLILARSEVKRALDSITPAALNNDHPVVVPKGTVKKDRANRPADGGTPAGVTVPDLPSVGDEPGGPGAGPTEGAKSSGSAPGETSTPLLPGLGGKTSKGTGTGGGDATDETGKVLDGVADKVGDVVETLLPDTPIGGPVGDAAGDSVGDTVDDTVDDTLGDTLGGLLP